MRPLRWRRPEWLGLSSYAIGLVAGYAFLFAVGVGIVLGHRG